MQPFLFLVVLLYCLLKSVYSFPCVYTCLTEDGVEDLGPRARVSELLSLSNSSSTDSLTPPSSSLVRSSDSVEINRMQGHEVTDRSSVRISHMTKHGAFFAAGRTADVVTHSPKKFIVAAKFRLDADGIIDQAPLDRAIMAAKHMVVDKCFIMLPSNFANTLARQLSQYLRAELDLTQDPTAYYFWLHPVGISPGSIAQHSYEMYFDSGLIQQTSSTVDNDVPEVDR